VSYDPEVLVRKRAFAETLAWDLATLPLKDGKVVQVVWPNGLQGFVVVEYPDGKRETFGIKVSGRAGR
jgi:hypothetical protein